MRMPYRPVLAGACFTVAIAGLSIVVAPPSLGAQRAARATRASAARFDSVRTFIRRVMEENAVASIAVAVAKDGEIVLEEGFGWADRERMIAATPHTMYSLASISKPITATGLMTLVERGTVQLDRPINDYLGAGKLTGLAGEAREATVRRVLSHTAGLPLHYQFFYQNASYGRPTMDETIGRYGILAIPPGEAFEYSNLGYGIIDHVIARASRQSYADYMRVEVFLPLGMMRTSVDIAAGLEPYAAQRYDSKQRAIPFYTFDHPGGSAVYASAHDLVRFGMFHLKNRLRDQRRILADSSLDLMQRVHTPDTTAGGYGYGLGWLIRKDDNGYRVVSHTGGMPGVATVLNLYPSENVAVVVLANKSDGAPFRIAEEIAAAVLPRYAATRAERRSRPAAAGTITSFPPPELAGAWTGTLRTYDSTVTMALLFQPDGDVHVTLGNQLRTLLGVASYQNGNLVGRFAGTIPSDEQGRHQHSVLLDLRLRDSTLRGQATAQTTQEPIYYALSSYVELARVADRPLGDVHAYTGVYLYAGAQTTRRVYADGGKLMLEGPFGPRTLLHRGHHTFVLADDPGTRVVFTLKDSRATGFAVTSGTQTSEATRVKNELAKR